MYEVTPERDDSIDSYDDFGQNSILENVYFKKLVFGGVEGLIITFTIMTSCYPAQINQSKVIILTIAMLAADALHSTISNIYSFRSYLDETKSRRQKELRNLQNENRANRLENMVELFIKKDVSPEDAGQIVHTLSKYQKAFVDLVMMQDGIWEIGEDGVEHEEIKKTVFVSVLSRLIFGCVPLLPYIIGLGLYPTKIPDDFFISIAITVIALFVLGSIKAPMDDIPRPWWHGGISTTSFSGFAASVGYLVGLLMHQNSMQIQTISNAAT